MSLSNNYLLTNLYHGLSTPDATPLGSPASSVRNVPPSRHVLERESSMSCFDGMVVDNDDANSNAKPAPLTTRLFQPMPPFNRPSFDSFTAFDSGSNLRRLSISMNGLPGVPNTDSLSRSKGGELPVLEHLLSADGARTLSLGKLVMPAGHCFSISLILLKAVDENYIFAGTQSADNEITVSGC